MLVVFVDNKSAGDENDLKKVEAAKELYATDVNIIPVAIGNKADSLELVKVTIYKENLIEETKEASPKELAKTIMEKTFSGKLPIFRPSL